MNEAATLVRQLLERGQLDLAPPGGGSTARRHQDLFEIARRLPLSVARLAEAHADALAIRHEAGLGADRAAIYGVWASVGAKDNVTVDWASRTLSGVKPFCSGLGIADRALVTACDDKGITWLVDVELGAHDRISYDLSVWASPALKDACTGSVVFERVPFREVDVVGGPGWYLDRCGFWHGACGPAACWAGGAAGVLDAAEALIDDEPSRQAHLGAMRAHVWAMRAVLEHAGHAIDDDPTDHGARYRAIALRHTIERASTAVLDHFSRAFGPRPFVSNTAINQRCIDVHLYLRQHSGERDLQCLATLDVTSSGSLLSESFNSISTERSDLGVRGANHRDGVYGRWANG